MTASRWDRMAPLAGAASVVLYFVGFALIGEVGSTATPSSEQVVDLLEDGPVQIIVGVYISLVSVALLIWFVASLRSRLSVAEGGTGRLAATAFGGGLVAATALAVGFGSIGQAAFRAESDEGIHPEVAVVFYDLYRAILGSAVPIGFGVLIGATAIVAFRTQVFPSWLVWSSVVVAIGSVSPLLFFFVFIALIWVLVVSIWLFIDGRKEPGADDP
jgi:hypothetical protein